MGFLSLFPAQGTIDLKLWEQVGKNLKRKYEQGESVPAFVLVTWSSVRAALCLEGTRRCPPAASSPSACLLQTVSLPFRRRLRTLRSVWAQKSPLSYSSVLEKA